METCWMKFKNSHLSWEIVALLKGQWQIRICIFLAKSIWKQQDPLCSRYVIDLLIKTHTTLHPSPHIIPTLKMDHNTFTATRHRHRRLSLTFAQHNKFLKCRSFRKKKHKKNFFLHSSKFWILSTPHHKNITSLAASQRCCTSGNIYCDWKKWNFNPFDNYVDIFYRHTTNSITLTTILSSMYKILHREISL